MQAGRERGRDGINGGDRGRYLWWQEKKWDIHRTVPRLCLEEANCELATGNRARMEGTDKKTERD